jgi:AraC family transcriptional regulator
MEAEVISHSAGRDIIRRNETEDLLMEPTIQQKPEIILLGMSFFGDPFDTHSGWEEENEIGRLWKRFMTFLEQQQETLPTLTLPEAGFEVHIYHPETSSRGVFEVFVGLQIEKVEQIPVELLIKILPPTAYAVFTIQGEEIASDWHLKIDQWITNAGYQRAHPFSFQYLDQRFKGVDNLAESELDVYMPIKPIPIST